MGSDTETEEKQSSSSVSTRDKHLPTDFIYLFYGKPLFLFFSEMTLRSEESIKVIEVLQQAEKFHLRLPLKPMTSGLSLNIYRSNSKLETKPNNPKGFVLGNFSTA